MYDLWIKEPKEKTLAADKRIMNKVITMSYRLMIHIEIHIEYST